ncbi:hypothetical protein [Sandarakinorhabdus sp.]|uniref:ImuA family protein n=1 Tax=Sandarakinorhabdus sp. TaxID=1916663 RepID=UPI00286DA382|nr:hypothetical protein [Sandarakinorhabdus sp.]
MSRFSPPCLAGTGAVDGSEQAPAQTVEPAVRRMALNAAELDAALSGGLLLAGLHEIHGPAADAFALMLALAAPRPGTILWVSDGKGRDGRLYGAGLAELGGDPSRLVLVIADGSVSMLRAAHEALSCPALACVIIESHGAAAALDLTASRRLHLTADRAGVLALLVRREAEPAASAALSRWQALPAPSVPLPVMAPGPPRLVLTLLRQRGGPSGISAFMEWNRDRKCLSAASDQGGAAHPGTAPATAAQRTPRRTIRRAA